MSIPTQVPEYERLAEALAEEALTERIEEIEVSDAASARELAFAGSPTIRIGGEDVEPARVGVTAFACRACESDGGLAGVPSEATISSAIRRARARARE